MTLLAALAVVALLPVAGFAVLGLVGSVRDHAPATKPAGGWLLALIYVAYAYAILAVIASVGSLFQR
jgi:hypothetical protein